MSKGRELAKIIDLKQENIHKVRSCFYQGGTWTKNQLSSRTGISLAGTTNILQILENSEEIEFVGNACSTGGRKSKLYQLREDHIHIGTIILSHIFSQYRIRANSFNLGGHSVYEQILVSPTGTLDEIHNVVKKLITSDPLIQVLVLSFPGIIGEQGEIIYSDFEQINQKNLLTSLSSLTTIPIVLENDVNVASLGYCSIHPEFRTLALLYQPDTDFAGSGIIINKRLHRGRNGFAGEVGYLMNGYKPANRQSRSNDFTFLLLNQITALISVIAPDAIAYYCPSLQEDIKISDTHLPKEFQPILERLTEIDPFILNGVQSIGKNKILEIKRRTI